MPGREEEDERPRMAIVGKPDGKENLHHQQTLGRTARHRIGYRGDDPGCDRHRYVHNGKEYVFIDTAGLHQKNKIKEELERWHYPYGSGGDGQ